MKLPTHLELSSQANPARANPARGWALLALTALAAAGVLALMLALARAPVTAPLMPWGPEFFYRALVTHVVLSFQIWLLAMGAVVALLASGAQGRLQRAALLGAWVSFALLLIPALTDHGQPLLDNYVPVLVDPLFIAALIALALCATVAALPALRLLASPDPARFGAGAMAAAIIAALACIAIGWVRMVPTVNLEFAVERILWGGGHVAQAVNSLMAMVAWIWLSQDLFGRDPLALPPRTAKALFAALLLFCAAAPVVCLLGPVDDLAGRQIFTRFLWFALPGPPAIMGAFLVRQIMRQPPRLHDPRYWALCASLGVFALGGVAGFFLGVGDTRTPSHYHAVIGGVNLALMGLFPAFLAPQSRTKPLLPWCIGLYGLGQTLHAVGFFAAGLAGVPRKTQGLEQGLNTAAKVHSMDLVGIGAGIAVLGGIGFIWILLRSLRSRTDRPTPPPALISVTSRADGIAAGVIAVAGLIALAAWLNPRPSPLTPALGPEIALTFRQWQIDPPLPAPVLHHGQTYRFVLHSADVIHSAAILGQEALVVPDQDTVLSVTPPAPGPLVIQCGEFCGNRHSVMSVALDVD